MPDEFDLNEEPRDDEEEDDEDEDVEEIPEIFIDPRALTGPIFEDEDIEEDLRPVMRKLKADLREAARHLTVRQVRALTDSYYRAQEGRMRFAQQERVLRREGEGHMPLFTNLLKESSMRAEAFLYSAMDEWTNLYPIGLWAKSIVGVGPVITAGILANAPEPVPYAGALWRLAGLDPTVKWIGREGAKKVVAEVLGTYSGELEVDDVYAAATIANRNTASVLRLATLDGAAPTRASLEKALARRPWNAALKRLCWNIGESFYRQQNHKDDFYGKQILGRKLYEWRKNLNGDYADQAEEGALRVGKTTDAYGWYTRKYRVPADTRYTGLTRKTRDGTVVHYEPVPFRYDDADHADLPLADGDGVPMLPPGRIHMRAMRWGVKLFLAHWIQVRWETEMKEPARLPWVVEHGGHHDLIEIPNYVPLPRPINGEENHATA